MSKLTGYMGKVLFVDLTNKNFLGPMRTEREPSAAKLWLQTFFFSTSDRE